MKVGILEHSHEKNFFRTEYLVLAAALASIVAGVGLTTICVRAAGYAETRVVETCVVTLKGVNDPFRSDRVMDFHLT
jgi:hypothetical protein